MNIDRSRTTHDLLGETRVESPIQGGSLVRDWTKSLETFSFSAVMAERRRLAGEIHDTLAQEFAGILRHLEAVRKPEGIESYINCECLARARELAKSGLEDTRRMLMALRPKPLDGATLSDALQKLAERFSSDWGMICKFRAEGPAQEIPVEIEDELFRVAQESLCNVRKHSRATSASISLRYGTGVVVLMIKDNGQGFATATGQQPGRGHGLSTMSERAQRLGGKIEIETGPGTGAEIRITAPVSGSLANRKD